MLQLPVIIVLVISMFAGRVSPVMQKEVEVNDKGNVHDAVLNNISKNLTDTISNNISNNKSVEQPTENVTKKSRGVISVTVPPESLPVASTATPVNGSKKAESNDTCTSYAEEQEDMTKSRCKQVPDNDDLNPTLPLNTTEPTTTVTNIAINKTEVNTESQIPEVKDKEHSEKNKAEASVNVTTPSTDQISYEVVSHEPNHLVKTTHSDVSNTDVKHITNSSEASIESSLLEDKAAISSGNVVAVKSADAEPKAKRTPSGIIALVTAISFAVVIALMYIGMIVWRRYVEYRYGHRELLVNELEFDTNDLRHFEL